MRDIIMTVEEYNNAIDKAKTKGYYVGVVFGIVGMIIMTPLVGYVFTLII